MPDDACQLDQLAVWARTPAALARILTHNPAALYGFATRQNT
jgi:hypothetical protein